MPEPDESPVPGAPPGAASAPGAAPAPGAPSDPGGPTAAKARFESLITRVTNWGRWGDDDERGTVNLIDDAARRRAGASVRQGRAFHLGLPLSERDGIIPSFFAPVRVNPAITVTERLVLLGEDPDGPLASEDMASLSLQCATHWDALAHISHRGRLYNGFDAAGVTEEGARWCGIDKIGPLVTRGILLDVARARGLERLPGGTGVTPDDLDAACRMAGTTPEPGDAVLVRTGQMAELAVSGPEQLPRPDRQRMAYAMPSPGLTMACAAWFHDAGVAAVASDTLALEVLPGEDDAVFLPVHVLHLVYMGLTQGQNWVLDELAADCAADGTYTFLLDATPLPVSGGLGSPLNPVAVK